MAVHYKTADGGIVQQSPGPVSKRGGGLILCYFGHAEDLLFGIEALQSLQIPMHEIYTPVYIEGMKSKLDLRKSETGYAVLKYGCFGSASISPLLLYALNHNWRMPSSGDEMLSIALSTLFLLATFLYISWLMTVKPPKIIRPSSNDHQFAIVIKTRHIIMNEGVTSFLQYSGSVEITRAVKNMLAG